MKEAARPTDGVLADDEAAHVRDKGLSHTRDHASSDESDTASDHPTQAGVKRIEAVSKAWTKTYLIIAYVAYVNYPI